MKFFVKGCFFNLFISNKEILHGKLHFSDSDRGSRNTVGLVGMKISAPSFPVMDHHFFSQFYWFTKTCSMILLLYLVNISSPLTGYSPGNKDSRGTGKYFTEISSTYMSLQILKLQDQRSFLHRLIVSFFRRKRSGQRISTSQNYSNWRRRRIFEIT